MSTLSMDCLSALILATVTAVCGSCRAVSASMTVSDPPPPTSRDDGFAQSLFSGSLILPTIARGPNPGRRLFLNDGTIWSMPAGMSNAYGEWHPSEIRLQDHRAFGADRHRPMDAVQQFLQFAG